MGEKKGACKMYRIGGRRKEVHRKGTRNGRQKLAIKIRKKPNKYQQKIEKNQEKKENEKIIGT